MVAPQHCGPAPGTEFSFTTEEGGREGTLWRYRLILSPTGPIVAESFDVRWIPCWIRAADVATRRHRQLERVALR